MKLMRVQFTIFMCLFVTFITKASETDTTLLFLKCRADSFYRCGQFEKVISDCERILFQTKDAKERTMILILKANAFKQLGLFQNANSTLITIPIVNLDSIKKTELYFQMALNCYLSSSYDESGAYLSQMGIIFPNDKIEYEAELLKILVLNELALWDSSEKVIEKSKLLTVDQKNKLKDLYHKSPNLLNHKRLDWCSRIIPGSGQVISGHFVEGSISFLLCASALAIGTYEVYSGFYCTGYFLGAGFLNGFYYGGLRRLEVLVENENKIRKKKFNEMVINVLK